MKECLNIVAWKLGVLVEGNKKSEIVRKGLNMVKNKEKLKKKPKKTKQKKDEKENKKENGEMQAFVHKCWSGRSNLLKNVYTCQVDESWC